MSEWGKNGGKKALAHKEPENTRMAMVDYFSCPWI